MNIRSLYNFKQFQQVLQNLAHKIALEAMERLDQSEVRITMHGGRFSIVKTDKFLISFYARHITYIEQRTKDYRDSLCFDVEEKLYSTSNHSTKISFDVFVEGKYNEKTHEYVEVGRKEKEQKRAAEIEAFIEKLMAEASIKPVPRFSLQEMGKRKG